MKKRIVCILLAVMMIVMSLPMCAFAAQFPAAQYKNEAQWSLNNQHYLAAAVLFELAAKAYEDEGDLENARQNHLASEAAYLDLEGADPAEEEEVKELDLDEIKAALTSITSDVLAMAEQGISKIQFLNTIDLKADEIMTAFGIVEQTDEIITALVMALADIANELAENGFAYYAALLYINVLANLNLSNPLTSPEFTTYMSLLEDAVSEALNIGDWESAFYFYGAAARTYETAGDTENSEKYEALAEEIEAQYSSAGGSTATIRSEGSKLVLVSIITAIIFGLGGFFLGKRPKKGKA